jgi:hypothetical protein
MVDIVSVLVGFFAGGSVGYMVAALVCGARVEAEREKYEKLHREYSRITDRDSRGRFTKRS